MPIMFCACSHAFQDEKYGKHQRVHTTRAKDKGFRCTVCGHEKALAMPAKTAAPKPKKET